MLMLTICHNSKRFTQFLGDLEFDMYGGVRLLDHIEETKVAGKAIVKDYVLTLIQQVSTMYTCCPNL